MSIETSAAPSTASAATTRQPTPTPAPPPVPPPALPPGVPPGLFTAPPSFPVPDATGQQIATPGGVQVVTSPDGMTTMIVDHGRVTTINVNQATGLASVSVDGQPLIANPSALGASIRRVAQSSSSVAWHGPTFRINGEAVRDDVVLVAGLAGGAIACALLGFPLVGWLARRSLRRAWRPAAGDEAGPPRLERIEQAVESIALEMERAAEAQRYSARLLSERLPDVTGPLPARQPAAELRGAGGGRVHTPH